MPWPAAAAGDRIEVSHRGVTLVGVPPDPAAHYDVTAWNAARGLEAMRAGLDLLLARSPTSAAVLETLKSHGRVVLVYHPGFPFEDASGAGVTLGGFAPYLLSGTDDPAQPKSFPVLIGRYIVKWGPEEIAVTLAHELLGHGLQHLDDRLVAMAPRDAECEAGLYEEIARQDLGVDKRAPFTVRSRRDLEWRWCVPFKQYLSKHRPGAMAIWRALDIDAARLLDLFEAYLRAAPVE